MKPPLSSDFYQALLEDSPQASLVYDSDQRCCWVSPGFTRMACRDGVAYLGQPIGALWGDVHSDDQLFAKEAWDALWAAASDSRTISAPVLFRMKVRSGDYRLMEVSGVNRLNEPDLRGVVLHFFQVVDRKRSEDLLLSERERLLVTLRSIGDGVVATDREGRVTLMNSVTEGLTGWTQAEALGRPLPEVFHIVNEETGVRCENPVDRVFASGLIVGLANHTALISRSGQVYVIEDSAAPIRDGSGRIIGAILVFRDVTEAKKNAAELARMQKLESIGLLAGGIAHDFNNILSAILGNASLGALMIDPGHPLQETLSGIEQAARRASSLTQQLLTFSKGGSPLLEPTCVRDLIEEGTRFVLRGSLCGYQFELPGDLEWVLADQGQLGQVVQNLVLNASQAMSEGGTITVRGANTVLEASGGPPLPPGRYVKLEFADQGKGISAEHLDKIFEPYFTTKATGSGLGLSVVWSIVRNHGGWIDVWSQMGKGTVFTVWLPATPPKPPVTVAVEDMTTTYRGTALVMDDEEAPRVTLAGMLKHLGYRVVVAESGDAALAPEIPHGDILLALVDLTVRGGMGGRELLPLLKARNPQIRVLVTSGYSQDPVMADHRGFGFDGVVRKPFTITDLTRAIHQALEPPVT